QPEMDYRFASNQRVHAHESSSFAPHVRCHFFGKVCLEPPAQVLIFHESGRSPFDSKTLSRYLNPVCEARKATPLLCLLARSSSLAHLFPTLPDFPSIQCKDPLL